MSLQPEYAAIKCERWLVAHLRGKVEIVADENGNGFIVSRSCIDPATGNESEHAATAAGTTMMSALGALMEDE